MRVHPAPLEFGGQFLHQRFEVHDLNVSAVPPCAATGSVEGRAVIVQLRTAARESAGPDRRRSRHSPRPVGSLRDLHGDVRREDGDDVGCLVQVREPFDDQDICKRSVSPVADPNRRLR
jgi:hypothetical protein